LENQYAAARREAEARMRVEEERRQLEGRLQAEALRQQMEELKQKEMEVSGSRFTHCSNVPGNGGISKAILKRSQRGWGWGGGL
jgi:hypothetical protein